MAWPLAHILTLALAAFAAGCASEAPPAVPAEPDEQLAQGRSFVESRAYRRAALEAAVVSPGNRYSATRLANYATPEGGWEALPVWQPTVRALRTEGVSPAMSDWSVEWTHDGLMSAGKRAFLNYPMRADRRLEPLRDVSRETAGFWVAEGRVGGLVEVGDQLAWTCATCHARRGDGGALSIGVPNADIDIAALYHLAGEPNTLVDEWSRGTLDPSDDGVNNPSTIGDLRAVRFQSHLHWAATLRNSLTALAIRVETLYIVSNGQTYRPPRELAFAIAYYLWNLGSEPPEQRSELFETNCGTCHHADGSVGNALPWGEPHPGRGTGYHRIPSLIGVADRGRLLHDGRVSSVAELVEAGPDWHSYGRQLDGEERAALVGYVKQHFR